MPTATQSSGFSATMTGMPVSRARSLSRLRSSAPPPVSTMPRSIMSAASSGGHFSRVTLTASIMAFTVSFSASEISSEVMVSVLGRPVTRSRPRISIVSAFSSGSAEPMSILSCSAVRSPTIRLYWRLTYWMIDSSISSPATRTERLVTMPPSEMTATSVVPPPMSTTMLPVGSHTGRSAPIAAANGSSMM
ncbi:hypothetical protein D3C71_1486930 [compost metagenome]